MTEKELIRSLQNKEKQGYEKLLKEYSQKVFNVIYKYCGDYNESEDLTLEVFTDIYRSIDTFREDSLLSTWIYRITVNKALEFLRKKNAKKRFAIFGKQDSEIDILSNIPDYADTPEMRFDKEVRKRILHFYLNKLPENQKKAIILSTFEDMSYSEISKVLKKSVPAVESLIHRGKENLKKKLIKFYKNNL